MTLLTAVLMTIATTVSFVSAYQLQSMTKNVYISMGVNGGATLVMYMYVMAIYRHNLAKANAV